MEKKRGPEDKETEVMHGDMAGGARSDGRDIARARIRMLAGMALAMVVLAVLVVSAKPGAQGGENVMLSQALLSDNQEVDIDSEGLAARVVEQKFQIHMEEMDQQAGEIPYVEVWVLNDPFYPLMGEVGDLRDSDGVLASKEWQMLGFPDYEPVEGQATTGAPVSSAPTGSLPVTTSVTERVVMVQEIYEIRGIRYAKVKVNDQTYDKLKAGSDFGDVFRVQEIKDDQTVTVLCGDEVYELKVNQLRKI